MSKKLNHIRNIFLATNQQKILMFLIGSPDKSFMASEIIKAVKISRAGVNIALRQLAGLSLVKTIKKGKTHLYKITIDHKNPLVKQLRVLDVVINIYSLIKKLEPITEQVILFGSVARAENYRDSDIDLFVVTHHKEEVLKILLSSGIRTLKTIVKTPAEVVSLQHKDPVFYNEVRQGFLLWQKDEY